MSDTRELTWLPSRHAVGEIVLFQPSLAALQYRGTTDTALEVIAKTRESAILSKIVGVHHTEGVVLYDIVVNSGSDGTEFYEAYSLRYIDPFMLLDLE